MQNNTKVGVLICYCPEWCESGYQIAMFDGKEFQYHDQPNDMFDGRVQAGHYLWKLINRRKLMLRFYMEGSNYVVEEQILGFNSTKIKLVRYSSDLLAVRVNNDPVRPTTKRGRDWFNKHYKNKF